MMKLPGSALTADSSRPPGVLVEALPKGQRASAEPTTYGLVRAVHADAIAVQTRTTFSWASDAAVGAFPAVGALVLSAAALGLPLALGRHAGDVLESACCFFPAGLWGVWALVQVLRSTVFSLRDSPVLVNRRTRKLHWVTVEPYHRRTSGPPGLLREAWRAWLDAFGRRRACLVEAQWDALDAELRRLRGKSQAEAVWLSFGAPAEAGCTLAPFGSGFDQRRLWEHLRRYMEEGGPALGPGESCAPSPPRGFRAGLLALGGGRWLALSLGVDVAFGLAAASGALDGWQHPPNGVGGFLGRVFVAGCVFVVANLHLAIALLAGLGARFGAEAELPDEVLADAGPAESGATAAASSSSHHSD